MHIFLNEQKPLFSTAVEFVFHELSQIRTGRASSNLVESIFIEAYGASMELKGVASISTLDARTLTIEPWDKNLLRAIESGIQKANIGIQPIIDGSLVRLSFPALTQETRKQMVKLMKERLEEGRVRLRGIREKIREQIQTMEKEKTFSEDEKFKLLEELDDLTHHFVEEIEEIGKEKETEIMTL